MNEDTNTLNQCITDHVFRSFELLQEESGLFINVELQNI